MTEDRLRIEIDGQLRFEGARERGSRIYAAVGGGPDLPVDAPIGVLITGVDMDRARLHGHVPVVITRSARREMALVRDRADLGGDAFLLVDDLAFDPERDKLLDVLTAIG